MARTDASTPGWRRREFILLVFPVLAVLAAAGEIGDRPSGDRASAWGWFLGASAVAAVGGCAIRRSVVTSPSGSGRETAEHEACNNRRPYSAEWCSSSSEACQE
jgi:hypothetical protein